MTFERTWADSQYSSRRRDRVAASSLKRSARISRAPAKAAATSGTDFSRLTNAAATASGSIVACSLKSRSASGSKPASLAMVARVRRFGRNGAYKSSRAERVSAPSTATFRTSLSNCRSESDLRMASRRCSNSVSWANRSRMDVIATSSRLPVTSFRYRAMKGTVALSPNKRAVAETLVAGRFNSAAMRAMNRSSMTSTGGAV